MNEVIEQIPCALITPGENDRTVFDPSGLQELAASIQEHGLAQAIVVRPFNGGYQIVAGERRFRAIFQVLGLDFAPCVVREMDDNAASAIMLAENVGRKDLDPVDEALAYRKRVDLGWSLADIARLGGVSKKRVENRLRWCSVRDDILFHVRRGSFPVGHAEMLAPLDRNRQMMAAQPIIEGRPINARMFREIVDKLMEQQATVSMFDLALFGGQIQAAPAVTTTQVRYPTAADLPEVRLPDERHVGAIMAEWIGQLQAQGMEREAAVVGTLLDALAKANYVRVPRRVAVSEMSFPYRVA